MGTVYIELLNTEELDGEDLRDALQINRAILEANLTMIDFLLLRMEGDDKIPAHYRGPAV